MEKEMATLICPVCGRTWQGSIWGEMCPKCGRFVRLMDKAIGPSGATEETKKMIMEAVKGINMPGKKCPHCQKEIPPEIVNFPEIFTDKGTVVICPYCNKSVGEWASDEEGSYWVSYL